MRRFENFVLSALNSVLGYPYFNSVSLSAIFRLVEKFSKSSFLLSDNVWGVFTSLLESLGFSTAYITPVWELTSIRESHCALVTFDSLTLQLNVFRRFQADWAMIYSNRPGSAADYSTISAAELQRLNATRLEDPSFTAILVCGNTKSLADHSLHGNLSEVRSVSDSSVSISPDNSIEGFYNSPGQTAAPAVMLNSSNFVHLPAVSVFSDSATAAGLPEFSILDSVETHGLIALDKSGVVRHWNRGAELLTGFSLIETLGAHYSMIFTPEDIQNRVAHNILDSAVENSHYHCEGYRVKKDNSKFWSSFDVSVIRVPDESNADIKVKRTGEIVGFAVLMMDCSQVRLENQRVSSQREALRESEERQRLLIDSVLDYAIFMLDVNGAISSWNAGAQRLKGYSSQEIIGKHFSCFYPPLDIANFKPQRELLFAIENGRFEEEGWRRRKDGSQFWANVVITAMRNSSGELVGFAKVTRDMTERKRAQERLVQQQHELINTADRLKEADVAKTLFIQKLSHELRAPLNPVTLILTEFIDKYHGNYDKDPNNKLLHCELGEESPNLAINSLTFTSSKPDSNQNLNSAAVDNSFPPAGVVQDMEIALKNIQRECSLIDDLLDTTRLNTGKLKLEYREENIHELLEELVGSAKRGAAHQKGISIVCKLAAAHSMVLIDSARMAQVFQNIIGNSIKFTPTGGSITIETENFTDNDESPFENSSSHPVIPEFLFIRISDTGVGIASNYQEKIFELFAQAPTAISNSTNFQGLGLGLAITKGILDLHGATISAYSDGLNRGSTFLIKFPVAGQSAVAVRRGAAELIEMSDSIIADPNNNNHNNNQPNFTTGNRDFVASSGVFQSPQDRRVRRAELTQALSDEAKSWQLLVVEDDRISLKLLTAFLKSLGFLNLESAPSLAAAGKIVQQLKLNGRHVDLLISDIHLNDGTGFDIIKLLRHEFPSITIDGIICSGSGANEDFLTSQLAGFAVHLVKPIDSLKLAQAIIHIVGKRQTAAANIVKSRSTDSMQSNSPEPEKERKRKRNDKEDDKQFL